MLRNQSINVLREESGDGCGVSERFGRTAVALAAVLSCLGAVPQAAMAFPFDEPSGYRGYDPYYRDFSYREPRLLGIAPRRVHRRPEAGRDTVTAKPQPPKPLGGPVLIAVSIGSQHLTVYDNGIAVATAPVSTGMKGHSTPMGIFSVIQKERWHHSNLYSNAPMPFMQRITWSGVALHAGVLPGYPASHGCIRMPTEFAVRLWSMTRPGARVVVTRNDVAPFEITHPLLAALTAPVEPRNVEPTEPPAPGAAAHPDGTAALVPLPGDTSRPRAVASDAPPNVGPRNALPPPAVGDDIAFAATSSATPMPFRVMATGDKPVPLRPAIDVSAPEAPAQAKPAEPPLRSGPISLFVSRRERKLFVRKGFAPVFDVPVTIAQPQVPIGTHVFTLAQPAEGSAAPRWLAVSIGVDHPTVEIRVGKAKSRAAHEETAAVSSAAPSPQAAAAEALDRIELPPEVVGRVAAYVTPGASLIISDHGLGDETGTETDFIVVTR